ncbi:hypothetical protein L0P88_07350 [Muricauda sp. SCSIO 64092]|uniref:hypothetical protein n=1 Tax=Allomuricauda sp. SCSIO 64092 TaxID=2908842 RepID=UPI001FF675AA|nr:hypothetical protein [Muricauda sp. SCSIO 64092]UOY08364.1 hypothetical protein L0P88_07350 [Muricauda sp. SCSIO 64092]
MFGNFLKYIQTGSSFQGLEVFSTPDRSHHYALILIRKKKNELVMEQQMVYEDWETMARSLKSNLPLCIAFSLEGIITKKTDAEKRVGGEALVNHMFPNINFDTIFFETYPLLEDTHISISKKKSVLEHLERLEKVNIKPVSLFLGCSALSAIVPYITNSTIGTNTFSLRIDRSTKKIVSLQASETSVDFVYELNGLAIKSQFLMAFGAILGYLSPVAKNSNLSGLLNLLRTDFTNKRLFSLLVRFSLFLILGVLMANFLIFNHYFNKVQKLRELTSITENNREIYQGLLEKVTAKEERLKTIVSHSSSKVSYYLDELASRIPGTIRLEQLIYQPLATPVRETKPILLEKNKIKVIGTTQDHVSFSGWIEALEELPWIHSIQTVDFDYEKSNRTRFGIEISCDE